MQSVLVLHMIYFYPGRLMLDETNIYGPTINLRFLWEDIIMTTEPQHIKVCFKVYSGNPVLFKLNVDHSCN